MREAQSNRRLWKTFKKSLMKEPDLDRRDPLREPRRLGNETKAPEGRLI
jgi:hypothetical protein